jgi:hypothetical protein
MNAARVNRIGRALFLTWIALAYGLVNCIGFLPNEDRYVTCVVYGFLLWLALGLWGLCHCAFVLYRAAFPAVTCAHCAHCLALRRQS